jgi:hypothetical protein
LLAIGYDRTADLLLNYDRTTDLLAISRDCTSEFHLI